MTNTTTMTAPATAQFIDTPDGAFGVIADGDGAVISSGWTSDLTALMRRMRPAERPASVELGHVAATDAVRAYYDGDLAPAMAVKVRQRGTELQHRGWDALRVIPAGAPLSYSEFAVALGSPTAVRAAASVCARNAVALFVPCHRVLRSDGSLGGFAWGVDVKRALLARESAG